MSSTQPNQRRTLKEWSSGNEDYTPDGKGFIGIEKEKEYVEIAKAKVKAILPDPLLF